jgi:KUP system potassium uptake protein
MDRPDEAHDAKRLPLLVLGALGVVFGDIGTSPLYALRECFAAEHGIHPNEANVLGVLSLIAWSLTILISVKYVAYVMRADNKGEGGILALMARVHRGGDPRSRGKRAILALGIFGAALLYGDGGITPSISVLSAVEGLEVATPVFTPYVIPITIALLFVLFYVQSRGTQAVGALFGPVMFLWFAALALMGVAAMAKHPSILAAVSPHHGVAFMMHEGRHALVVLGSVFLAVTGGEALYADMGHFGRRPIRIGWFVLVFPALLLNYYGQGALMLELPPAAREDPRFHPFFMLVRPSLVLPLVVLSAAATCIASQALISGAFSLTRQAIQLGYCPRTRIAHTSHESIGQIYVPAVNWAIFVACVALVLAFKRSGALAAAYGIAVTLTMLLTTMLMYAMATNVWGWRRSTALAVTVPLLAIELAFFAANALKIREGGWFPLAVGGGVYFLMATWKRGREILADRLRESRSTAEAFLARLDELAVTRVKGTAVFMSASPEGVPFTMVHHARHNLVLHERVLVLTIVVEEQPTVPAEERVVVTPLSRGLHRVVAHYGYMEHPTMVEIFKAATPHGLPDLDAGKTTFYIGRETLIPTSRPGMAIWREHVFAFMSRNAAPATSFFGLPSTQVFEVGVQIEL